jgi:hypothetical protein
VCENGSCRRRRWRRRSRLRKTSKKTLIIDDIILTPGPSCSTNRGYAGTGLVAAGGGGGDGDGRTVAEGVVAPTTALTPALATA